ncbi:D-alanyl-D-alanine carboxypeptidase/D-alanyl-D-alanine endopeptidase [Rhodoferax aquaticus]|uniref:D-alanyl-D-alanine carboxypeptidase/D-alanyl-D-alanine-endopeptidase n=1 Tax=Rhodoferax aquaticus TaxID=2527691 RepID=A0A515EJR1_9BURK|nr:D-alanyl-D-alanine carboxypeptidase/D-alanyl-D-alanine-endopeptidase [Rhodoferax aquaticus]QDL52901.1 D-alanyl-D-alanine carboxypeptidase/D-alanyl-D-alanine-endopeptidase [Rhodoferax aquaticus]
MTFLPTLPSRVRRAVAGALRGATSASLLCATFSMAWAQNLPPEAQAALARAKVPEDAVSVLLVDAQNPNAAPRLNLRTSQPMNPASVMKLVTTYAGLDLLGPAYSWRTPVFVDGTVREGTLQGNLYIKGQGDPKLVMERLWLLLRRVQGLGIKAIAGDIVLDRSAFDVPDADPASFDGEPLRPYNASPDALLLNYKALVMTFTPDRSSNTTVVQFDPPLAGVLLQTTVPLSNGDCGDYRGVLKADFSDPKRIRFTGGYPASCGEKVWPVAYADPKTYAVRAVQGLWQDLGGKLSGSVRLGTVPAALAAAKPAFETESAPLAEVIRDINKYSNNVMAQQLFLTLGREVPLGTLASTPPREAGEPAPVPGNFAASRAVVQRWWKERISPQDVPVLDNGSGLSRSERISAQGLGRLLHTAYASPWMSELMSSLPITGVDGTLKRVKTRNGGSAHLKTGTLSNVVAVAGYVDGASGKRYVLVVLINHPNASAARPAIEALVDWAARDGG